MSTDFNLIKDMALVTGPGDFAPDQNDETYCYTDMRRRVEDRLELRRLKDELGVEELFFD